MVKAFMKKKPRISGMALHKNSLMIKSKKRICDHKNTDRLEEVPAKGQERK